MANQSTRRRFLATLGGLPVIWGGGDDPIPLVRRGKPGAVEILSDSPLQPETLWEETYGSDFIGERAHSVIETSDRGYLFAGHLRNVRGDAQLVKTDTGGTILWEKRYDDKFNQDIYTVIETSVGGIFSPAE